MSNGPTEVWQSGPVINRLSPSVVLTRSGSLYRLVGALSKKTLQKSSKGLPLTKEIIRSFSYGFPRNWEKFVEDVFKKSEESL